MANNWTIPDRDLLEEETKAKKITVEEKKERWQTKLKETKNRNLMTKFRSKTRQF